MDLHHAMRTTGAVREFRPNPVDDDTLYRILDHARFAPSGGNRQAWHVVVLRDRARRKRLRELYCDAWYTYLAMGAAGLRPWAPGNDPAAEAEAAAGAERLRAGAAAGPGGFAEHLEDTPVLLALLVRLGELAAVDRDLGRYGFAGGASVYPFAQNVLLAARAEGIGGVITTMAVRHEPEVLELLGAPQGWALAAIIALGWPVQLPTRLARSPVASFTTIDTLRGEPFSPPTTAPPTTASPTE